MTSTTCSRTTTSIKNPDDDLNDDLFKDDLDDDFFADDFGSEDDF